MPAYLKRWANDTEINFVEVVYKDHSMWVAHGDARHFPLQARNIKKCFHHCVGTAFAV